MKQKLFAIMAAAVLLLDMTCCTAEVDNPSPGNVIVQEQDLIGLWWDEFDYSDVTETGVPFSRVLLAVDVKADHTGCLYLAVYNDTSSEPLAAYGGPDDAGFKWALLPDGRVQLSDPASGESIALARTRGADGGNYGNDMTNVSGTNVNYADGHMTVTNSDYSGTLEKADAHKQATIEQQMNDKVAIIPMTVEALTAGKVKVNMSSTLSTGMKYSVNSGEKTLITTSTDIPVNAGDKVQFYGNGTATQVYGDYHEVKIQGSGAGFKCKAYGNIMSLLDEEGFATKTDLPNKDNVFYGLFSNNTALTDAGYLVLPATTLTENCYYFMFSRCTALTTAPTLPATTLARNCYLYMFSRCTALTTAPALPATTLAEQCYTSMFNGCTALTTAPELPATTLAARCYSSMFSDCTALTTAPALTATTLAVACYYEMFSGCTALTTAPALPATTLAETCYYKMFSRCTALTTAPELPATTLAGTCYLSMFENCTALTTAPDLPATTLAARCYEFMFSGCTNLNSVKCLATSGFNTDTSSWLEGVAASGTFYLASGADWPQGASGIPRGWSAKYPDGTTMPRALAKAAAGDLGKLAGADGNIYDTNDDAILSGTTVVAMIAYVGSDTENDTYKNGLAIALTDEPGEPYWNGMAKWANAKSICASKSAVSGALWQLPGMVQLKSMLRANGGNEESSSGLKTAITNAGGTTFRLNEVYWLRTEYYSHARYFDFREDFFGYAHREMHANVRACLVF